MRRLKYLRQQRLVPASLESEAGDLLKKTRNGLLEESCLSRKHLTRQQWLALFGGVPPHKDVMKLDTGD